MSGTGPTSRTSGTSPGPAAAASAQIEELFAFALGQHRVGQLAAAEDAYRRILAIDPDHARTLHFLGVLVHQLGRSEAAVELIRRAIARSDPVAEFHYNLGVVLEALKQPDEAAAHYRQTIALKPEHANAHLNLGNVLLAHNILDESEAASRRAIALNPGSPDARVNLGIALMRRHWNDAAIAQFRAALQLKPNHAAAHGNLGVAYSSTGQHEKAAYHCRQCLALAPYDYQAAAQLGLSCLALGEAEEAFELSLRILAVEDTLQGRYLFTHTARSVRATEEHAQFRDCLRRALAGAWDRPANLMRAAVSVIKTNSALRAAIERPADAIPVSMPDPRGTAGFAEIAGDALLRELMRATPIYDGEVERVLTALRRGALDLAADESAVGVPEQVLQFYCALAEQCFCNEYVYAMTEDEQHRATRLGKRLDAAIANGEDVPPLWIAAVGAYEPLHARESAGMISDRTWPPPVAAVVRQQIAQPRAQAGLRALLPTLTAIEDRTSIEVKRQYEENPYPRWIRTGSSQPRLPFDVHLGAKYPGVSFKPLGKDRVEILIAGCGTGQHAIETSLRYIGCDVLAVDLSAVSLSYASYKTRELGLTNIRYAVADILKLDTLGRSFDVIEACGVLHHLADPLAAWRLLLSILRPGGVMNVGLYSEIAREPIKHARAFIAEHGYPATVDGIRRCRREMTARTDDRLLKSATEYSDFFSVSECRDLLFHVQEHLMTLPQIAAFIAEENVAFLGFDADAWLLKQYAQRFPDDRAKTDLASWHEFEIENPRSFASMYRFWVQKP